MKKFSPATKKLVAFVIIAAMLCMFAPEGFLTGREAFAASKTVTSISIKSKPSKLKYKVGNKLSTKGLKLTVKYKGGSKATISSGFTCTPTKLSKAGTQKITVKYKGKKTSFNVTVSKVVKSIKIKAKPAKLKYKTGEKLNTKGLKLTVTYTDKSTKAITSGFTCSPTKFTKTGTQKVTVKYGGKSASFNVTVSKATSSLPALTNANVGKVLKKQIYCFAGCFNGLYGNFYDDCYYYNDETRTISTEYYLPDDGPYMVYFRSRDFKNKSEVLNKLREYVVITDRQFDEAFSFIKTSNYLYFGVEMGEAHSLFNESFSVLEHKNGEYKINADYGIYYPCSSFKIRVIVDNNTYKLVYNPQNYYSKSGGYKYEEGDFIMGFERY